MTRLQEFGGNAQNTLTTAIVTKLHYATGKSYLKYARRLQITPENHKSGSDEPTKWNNYLVKLFETNECTILSEALTTHVQTVFADEPMSIGANTTAATSLTAGSGMRVVDSIKAHSSKERCYMVKRH
ncbi:hypothetical protein ECG_09092 [Echinococcus granulosus]|uniref:Expressed protein n=1 Tax=Echinococcus granulosus TaxID=6210 RepID=A0A068WMI6_ECHGR|nr:hypothetical protein ECG_09092 [Echinococcus granulosus]CDS21312.1 expressed protein [Echinococcus granulosus]